MTTIFIFTKYSSADPKIFEALTTLVGGEIACVDTNVLSPLWNHMNFELAYDKSLQKFIPLYDYFLSPQTIKKSKIKNDLDHIQRIAIKFHPSKDYTVTSKRLFDYHDLEKHNLENEGYKVIDIPEYKWKEVKNSNESVHVEFIENLFREQKIFKMSKLLFT